MSVRIRLSRYGKKHTPFYRLVVTDRKNKRDGGVIEVIGTYNPMQENNLGTIKKDRVEYWLGKGAEPSRTVAQMLKRMSKAQPTV